MYVGHAGNFLEVLIMRIKVFQCLFGGPPANANYNLGSLKHYGSLSRL